MDDSADPGRARDTGSAASDEEAGFDIRDDFRRFSQRDDIFCRSFWDPEVRTHRSDMFYETYRTPKLTWRSVDGFTQRDYALRNASWHVTDIFAELRGDDDRREGFPGPVHRRPRGPGKHAAGGVSRGGGARDQARREDPGRRSGGDHRQRRAVALHACLQPRERAREAPGDLHRSRKRDRDRAVDGPGSPEHGALRAERDRDGSHLLPGHHRAARHRAVHHQSRLPGRGQHERLGAGHPARHQGRAGRVRPPRPPHHPRVRSPGAPRQGLHRHAARPRPARPVRREGDVRHLPRVHERLPREGHRRRRAVHRGPQPVEHPGHPQSGPRTPRSASVSGPTRTPTARSACASVRTTATIATCGVEYGAGWRALGSGAWRSGWTASAAAASA